MLLAVFCACTARFVSETMLVFPRGGSYIVILQIYKNLAEDVDINGNSSTDENSQQMALLMKSKSSFYQALDRLGSDRHEVGLMKGIGVRVIGAYLCHTHAFSRPTFYEHDE